MSDPHKRYEVLEKDLAEALAEACYELRVDFLRRLWGDIGKPPTHPGPRDSKIPERYVEKYESEMTTPYEGVKDKEPFRSLARRLILPIIEELRQNVVDNDGWLWELYERQCAITEAKQDSLKKARRLRKAHMIDLGDDFKILAAVLPEEGSGLGAALRVSAYVISLQSKVAEMEAYVEKTARLERDLEESRMALVELADAIQMQVPHLPDRLIAAWDRVGRMAIPLPKGYRKNGPVWRIKL